MTLDGTGPNERQALSRGIIDTCKAMNASGINQGKSGNVSARFGSGMLITPSGVSYDSLKPMDIVLQD
ncbi:MAG: class II aldolase/adducin family protein, partial [Alphaproteobacteria bacterium]|nr:class II aldolase/adducin family protein [Alphaproteobacteria bacterium]